MAKTFHLTIATIGENLFEGDAVSATLPGAEGVFEILAGHEAFVSPLHPGTAHIVTSNGEKKEFLIVAEGIAEVSHNQATVLL